MTNTDKMNETKKPTLIIIDGNSVLYRAFHAIPATLTNPAGMSTNAVYGFTQTLRKILNDCKPDYIGVAFDVKGGTFRQKLFAEYKAQRPAMPDLLLPQIPYIKRIVAAYGIPILEREGFEADDMIATLVKRLAEAGLKIMLVTGDKDMYQLVSESVVILDYLTGKECAAPDVEIKFGVPPRRVRDLLGLAGDTSDNIPGVAGIGPKTAVKLINEFGSIDDIYANIERVKPDKLREKLIQHRDKAFLSRDLATLHPDVALDLSLDDLRCTPPDTGILVPLLRELDFKKLVKEAMEGEGASVATSPVARIIKETAGLEAELEKIKEAGRIAITILDSDDAPMLSICGATQEPVHIPLGNTFCQGLRPVLEDDRIIKDTDDSKRLYAFFKKTGIKLRGVGIDTSLASYILNPSKNDHTLDALSYELLGDAPTGKSLAHVKNTCNIIPLADMLDKRLDNERLKEIYLNLELPLSEVLADMELAGIAVDTERLKVLSKEMETDLGVIEGRIYQAAGMEFNINSPKQLAEVLFERLGLKPVKKTKTGFSTDEEVLKQLSSKHEAPELILSFRQISKLKSTYVDAIIELVDPVDGRVHTSFNQTVTATGRLSSSRPNLQNIPARGESAMRIREAFVAPQGSVFLSADYSQIELRIVAHLSEDPALLDAFLKDEDVHTRTASEVFGVMHGLVTPELRRRAKAINFGIIYGMGAYGLSAELGCSVKEAEEYIQSYFAHYKAVKAFIDRTIEESKTLGYTTTLFGRRRFIPELNSPVDAVARFGARMAVNTPIQGAAADMIKAAMIAIHKRLGQSNLRSRMLLQIHDELIFETPLEEAADLARLVTQEMEDAISLKVPIKVNIKQGGNWRVVE